MTKSGYGKYFCFVVAILVIAAFSDRVYGQEVNNERTHKEAEELYLQGLKLFNDKDYAAASKLFKKAVINLPDNSEIWNHLGTSYFNLSEFEDAEESFLKARERDPNNVEIMQNLALVQFKMKKSEEALKTLSTLLQLDPGSSKALSLMGLIYSQLEQYDAALDVYKKAVQITKKDSKLYYLIGNIYYKQGNLITAAEFYKKALYYNKNLVNASYNLANCYYRLDNFEKAVEHYEAGLAPLKEALEQKQKISEHHAKAFYNLGNIYSNQNSPQKAIDSFRAALTINPHFNAAAMKLAQSYYELGETASANEWYVKSLDMDEPDYSAYIALASIAQSAEKTQQALEYLLQLENKSPQLFTPEIRRKKAFLCLELNLWDKATETFQLLITDEHFSLDAMKAIAYIQMEKGDYASANAYFQNIERIVLEKGKELDSKTLWNKAITLEHLEEFESALESFKAIATVSKTGIAWLQVARIQYRQGNFVEVKQTFAKIEKLPWSDIPNEKIPPDFYTLYGATLLKLNEKKESRKVFQKALKHYPDNVTFLNNYAISFLMDKKISDAMKNFLKALDGDPGNNDVLFNLALLHQLSGDSKESINGIRKIAIGENIPVIRGFQLNLGHYYANQGLYEEALRHYRVGVISDPLLADELIIKCYVLMKNWERAYNQIKQLPSDSPETLLGPLTENIIVHVADQHMRKGEFSDALSLYNQLKLSESPYSKVLWSNKGYLEYELKDYDAARLSFSRAFTSASDGELHLTNNRALLSLLESKRGEALNILEQIEMSVRIPAMYRNIGVLYLTTESNNIDGVIKNWENYLRVKGEQSDPVRKWLTELKLFYTGVTE